MNLNNFLKSNFTFKNKEFEEELQYLLFNYMLSIMLLMLLILGSIRFYQKDFTQLYIDIFFALISLYSIFYIKKSKKHGKKIVFLLVVSYFGLISLDFFHNMHIVGPSWFIILLLPTFYLGGSKYGLLLTFASFISITILEKIASVSYSTIDYFYALMPLIVASLFIFLYEKRFNLIKEQLKLKNLSLEAEIKHKEKLLYQAHHDSLTELPNRALFRDRLQQAIKKSNRSKKDFAILFIDLDMFKEINDRHGHEAGDIVLCEISSRFKTVLREEDTIARFGGDEFLCIIEQIESSYIASYIAQKLIDKAKEPIFIPQKINLTCSIGISIYKQDTNSATELLRYADTAMYRAKDLGKNQWCFYSDC